MFASPAHLTKTVLKMRPRHLAPLLGSLLCWAMPWIETTPTMAQGDPTTRTTEFVIKVVGTPHFLALMADGTVWSWGR